MAFRKSKAPKVIYAGYGGCYFAWSPSCLPLLQKANISASKILIRENGLAIPYYSDSGKIAYVIQGNGTAGFLSDDPEDHRIVTIKEGDVVALPSGVITWWLNKNEAELILLFMGDTYKGREAGKFTEFPLSSDNGKLINVIGRDWSMSEEEIRTIIGNEGKIGIITVDENFKIPLPKEEDRSGIVFNLLENRKLEDSDGVVVITPNDLPLVHKVGFDAKLLRITSESSTSPAFSCDSSYQLTYIINGNGRIQIGDGQTIKIKAGDLFAVRLPLISMIISEEDGTMDCFSITTSPKNVA